MPALAQRREDLIAESALDDEVARRALARRERGGHRAAVPGRRVDRGLQVHAVADVVEHEQQLPLVLLVAARRAGPPGAPGRSSTDAESPTSEARALR